MTNTDNILHTETILLATKALELLAAERPTMLHRSEALPTTCNAWKRCPLPATLGSVAHYAVIAG